MSYSYFFNNGKSNQNGCAEYSNGTIRLNNRDSHGTFIIIPNGNAQLNFSSINNFSQFNIVSSSLSNGIWNVYVSLISDGIRILTRDDPIFVSIDIDKSDPSYISLAEPQAGDVLTYDGVSGKSINTPSSDGSLSNMPYKFIGGFSIDDSPSPTNGD